MSIVLVVDDEIGIRELLSEILMDEGFDVKLAENATVAKQIRNQLRPDLVLLDIWMPDMDGISLLKEWRSNGQLTMPVVMMSGHGTIDNAVEATRFGACDFLEKPITLKKLLSTVTTAIENDLANKRNADGQNSAANKNNKNTLTLNCFAKIPPIKEFHKRLMQMISCSKILLIKNIDANFAEICAKSILQTINTNNDIQNNDNNLLDLSSLNKPLNIEILEKLRGGVVYISDLRSITTKIQQLNINFVLERLDKLNLKFLLASKIPIEVIENNVNFAKLWDLKLLTKLKQVWIELPPLRNHLDDLPNIATILLTYFIENNEVPNHHFETNALNYLRTANWDLSDNWGNLYHLIKNIALTTLTPEISEKDIKPFFNNNENNANVVDNENYAENTNINANSTAQQIEKIDTENNNYLSNNNAEVNANLNTNINNTNANTNANTNTNANANINATTNSNNLSVELKSMFNYPLRQARDMFEKLYFEYHLKRENNNIIRLAEKTELERTHLYRKLKQLGINLKANSNNN